MEETSVNLTYKYILEKIWENTEKIIACSKEIYLFRQSKRQGLSETSVYIQEACALFAEVEEINPQLDNQLILEKRLDVSGQKTYDMELDDLASEGQVGLWIPFESETKKKTWEEEKHVTKEDDTKERILSEIYLMLKKRAKDVLLRAIQIKYNFYTNFTKCIRGAFFLECRAWQAEAQLWKLFGLEQWFSTCGSGPHLGSNDHFIGVAKLGCPPFFPPFLWPHPWHPEMYKWLGVTTTWGTVLWGRSIRKVENHWIRRKPRIRYKY